VVDAEFEEVSGEGDDNNNDEKKSA